MLPQLDNDVEITTTNSPSLTYKLNVTETDNNIQSYLESTGNARVDLTDFTLDINDSLELSIEITQLSVFKLIFGSSQFNHQYLAVDYNNTTQRYEFCVNAQQTVGGNERFTGIEAKLNNIYNIYYYVKDRFNSMIIINEEVFNFVQANSGLRTHSYTVQLFSSDRISNLGLPMKLYGCKAYKNNNLVYDLIPMPSGLYDKKSNAFMENAGNGTLTYGYSNLQYVDTIQGFVDNKDAIKQAIYHTLMTERYAYPIYSDNYGIELEQYIGRDFSYLEATIETTLKEALMYDKRITDIRVTEVTLEKTDTALVKFVASSIFGNVNLEVNISV